MRELSDLISLCAQISAGGPEEAAAELWLACTVTIAAGESPEHRAAKEAIRAGLPAATAALRDAATTTAATETAAAASR